MCSERKYRPGRIEQTLPLKGEPDTQTIRRLTARKAEAARLLVDWFRWHADRVESLVRVLEAKHTGPLEWCPVLKSMLMVSSHAFESNLAGDWLMEITDARLPWLIETLVEREADVDSWADMTFGRMEEVLAEAQE